MSNLFIDEDKENLIKELKINLISRFYPFSFDEILKYKHSLNFGGDFLMQNESIIWDVALFEHISDKIDWDRLSAIKNACFDYQFLKKFEKYINFKSLGYSRNIVWHDQILVNYADKFDWSGALIARIPIRKVELLRKYKDVLDWSKFSSSIDINFTPELIEEFKEYWEWNKLSCNPHLPVTVDFIKTHISDLNFTTLSSNPAAVPMILKYPDSKRWQWHRVIQNPGINFSQDTFDFLYSQLLKRYSVNDKLPVNKNAALYSLIVSACSSPKDVSFFLNENFMRYLPWDVLSRNTYTKLSTDFILKHKNRLNLKESNIINMIKDSFDTSFIIENLEKFSTDSPSFYHLPLSMDFIQTHIKNIDFWYLTKCQLLDWNWDFIKEHIFEFNFHFLSTNIGIYKRLIENSMTKSEILSILE